MKSILHLLTSVGLIVAVQVSVFPLAEAAGAPIKPIRPVSTTYSPGCVWRLPGKGDGVRSDQLSESTIVAETDYRGISLVEGSNSFPRDEAAPNLGVDDFEARVISWQVHFRKTATIRRIGGKEPVLVSAYRVTVKADGKRPQVFKLIATCDQPVPPVMCFHLDSNAPTPTQCEIHRASQAKCGYGCVSIH